MIAVSQYVLTSAATLVLVAATVERAVSDLMLSLPHRGTQRPEAVAVFTGNC
jgi:hypothetical protein